MSYYKIISVQFNWKDMESNPALNVQDTYQSDIFMWLTNYKTRLWLQSLIVPLRRWLAIIWVSHCKDHYFVPIEMQSWVSANKMKQTASMHTNHAWNNKVQMDEGVPFLIYFYLIYYFINNIFFNPKVTDIQSHWSWECVWKYYFSTNNLGAPKRLPGIYTTQVTFTVTSKPY